MNQSISDGGDCRTAPATPGLLWEMAPVLNSEDGSKSVLIQAHQFYCHREQTRDYESPYTPLGSLEVSSDAKLK